MTSYSPRGLDMPTGNQKTCRQGSQRLHLDLGHSFPHSSFFYSTVTSKIQLRVLWNKQMPSSHPYYRITRLLLLIHLMPFNIIIIVIIIIQNDIMFLSVLWVASPDPSVSLSKYLESNIIGDHRSWDGQDSAQVISNYLYNGWF